MSEAIVIDEMCGCGSKARSDKIREPRATETIRVSVERMDNGIKRSPRGEYPAGLPKIRSTKTNQKRVAGI